MSEETEEGLKRKHEGDGEEVTEFSNSVKRMKSGFERQDLALVVEGEHLYINRKELLDESPVFSKMFTADFKEKNLNEIELPGKDLETFLKFLRCLLSTYNDEITEENVHEILPLADEYAVSSLLDRIDKKLSCIYERKSFRGLKSETIIKYILEAEKYRMTGAYETLIDFASRKLYKYFSKAEGFDNLSEKTINEIAMTRWKLNINPKEGIPSCNTYYDYDSESVQ